eukprot:TRINITY_DN20013_c0_g1_i2.p1 TRINITY_DN20013_c0_g1~~TRINITY_DN20013_c0_g1_i2.p1  ORF type:complete len:576 (-),score=126.91 TRINITY_DN20013_c0_g1_i2:141-1868(-)
MRPAWSLPWVALQAQWLLVEAQENPNNAWFHVDVKNVICNGIPSESFIPETAAMGNNPMAISLYRASGEAAELEYTLQTTIPVMTLVDYSSAPLMLEAQTASRRAEAQSEAPVLSEDSCEEFWLLDGRPPVEIPVTWGEAKSAFLEMCQAQGFQDARCEDAEAALFRRPYQDPAEDFRPELELCDRLMKYSRAVDGTALDTERRVQDMEVPLEPSEEAEPVRRMQTKGTAGTAYYRDAATQARYYPAGFATTKYGYSGIGYGASSSYRPYIFPVLLGAGAVNYATYNSNVDYMRSGGDPGSPDGMMGESEFGSNYQSYDGSMAQPTGTLYRDDIVETAFDKNVQNRESYPLKFKVTAVRGTDFEGPAAAAICNNDIALYAGTGAETLAQLEAKWELYVTLTSLSDDSWRCYDKNRPRDPITNAYQQVPSYDCKSGTDCCDTEGFCSGSADICDSYCYDAIQHDWLPPQECSMSDCCTEEYECETDQGTCDMKAVMALVFGLLFCCCSIGCCCGCCFLICYKMRQNNEPPPPVEQQGWSPYAQPAYGVDGSPPAVVGVPVQQAQQVQMVGQPKGYE